jgi:hypothetical protein
MIYLLHFLFDNGIKAGQCRIVSIFLDYIFGASIIIVFLTFNFCVEIYE